MRTLKTVCCKILSKLRRLNKCKREGTSVSAPEEKETLKYGQLKDVNSDTEMLCKEKPFAETVV